MHGQKRSEYKSRLLNPETAAKLSKKAEQWNHLSHQLLSQRRRLFGLDTSAGDGGGDGGTTAATANPSPEMLLSLTEKMLSVNPDPSHLWNIRREMLLHAPSTASSATVEDGDNSNSPESSSPLFDIQSELTLTAHCLQRNPKSYSSWYHRKWALVHYLTHPKPSVAPTAACATDNDDSALAPEETSPHLQNAKSILQSELGLCKQFLELDERNFHCWNYRRFVVALSGSCKKGVVSAVKSDMEVFDGSWSSWLNQAKVMMGAQLSQSASSAVGGLPGKAYGGKGVDIAKSIVHLSKQELDEIIRNEWDFTTSKIEKNFSNGSAFHYRSKLLPLMLENQLSPSGQSGTPCPNERYDAILTLAWEEWREILKDAIFTEPDDQTPWWYHRFIVSWAKPLGGENDEKVEGYGDLLFDMAEKLRELIEIEEEMEEEGNNGKKDESKGAPCKWANIGLHLVLSTLLESQLLDDDEVQSLKEESMKCLAKLMTIDPDRNERYQMLASE